MVTEANRAETLSLVYAWRPTRMLQNTTTSP